MLIMFKFFKNIWRSHKTPQTKEPSEVKYLITGLGNIGPDYENTRHNIGFMILDEIAKLREVKFEPARYGDIAQFRFKGRIFFLLKPSTYMNLSGKAIHYWLTREKIENQNLLVITDDVALPLGTLRLKGKGSDGGHNGLSNIQSLLGTTEYARLRFGIGNNFPKGAQVHYVLGKWQPEEMEVIKPLYPVCNDLVTSFALQGIDRTMNLFNTKPSRKTSKTKEDRSSENANS
jgi:peptidyl-tRNA hydrolase, PTH1 family